ncbi:MAG TPA: peptidylprolyl isomerase [Desulfuromonadaceae bacterium]|jgi:parvulin-like peptidyl-prolyl isomerase
MIFRSFRFVIVSIAILCSAPLFLFAQEENSVVAIVNGIQLKKADLNQEYWKLLPQNRNYHGNVSDEKTEKLRAEALQKLVLTELQYQDALAKGMKLGESELTAEIEKLSRNYKEKEGFEAAIAGSGFDLKSFARFVERTVLAERISIAEIDNQAVVPDAMVKSYYEQNGSHYSKPREYRASHILIKFDPAANDEERARARSRAEAILKKVRDGGIFADIAAQESDDLTRIKGGDMGYFHAGQTESEFDAALAKMKVGEISDLVETIYGYHIIQLVEKKLPRQLPFEEVSKKIKNELLNNEKKRLSDLWLSNLKNKAVISYPGKK